MCSEFVNNLLTRLFARDQRANMGRTLDTIGMLALFVPFFDHYLKYDIHYSNRFCFTINANQFIIRFISPQKVTNRSSEIDKSFWSCAKSLSIRPQ